MPSRVALSIPSPPAEAQRILLSGPTLFQQMTPISESDAVHSASDRTIYDRHWRADRPGKTPRIPLVFLG